MSASPPTTTAAIQRSGFSERTIFTAVVAAVTLGAAAGTAICAYRRTARSRVDAAPSLLGGRDQESSDNVDDNPATLALEFESLMASERLRIAARPADRQTPAHCLRVPLSDDIPALGQSWFASYNAESRANGGSDLFPSLESAQGLVAGYVTGAGKVGLVAVVPTLALAEGEERKQSDHDEILASAFNDESDVQRGVVGCGPWTVSTGSQGRGVGFECISALVRASISRGAISLRLLQGTTNHASAALYSKLGFQVREPLAFFAGRPAPAVCSAVLALHADWTASVWGPSDVPAPAALWKDATGFSREGALAIVGASSQRKAKRWMLRDAKGNVLAFTTGFGSLGSSCAVSIDAFKHLLCAAAADTDAGFADATLMMHSCTRLYPQLTRWLLSSGLKITRTANLMCLGAWRPIPHARGVVYCPSTELS